MTPFPRDLVNTCVLTTAITEQSVAGAVTGASVDMINGDARCHLMVQIDGLNVTAGTFQVEESTGAFPGTVITQSILTVTTSGVTGVGFDRTKRYLRGFTNINGTTMQCGAFFVEGLKSF